MYRTLLSACVALVTFAAPAWANGTVRFDDGWKTQRFSLFSANRYSFQGNAVTVSSDAAVSLAYLRLPETFWEAQAARWQWQVAEGVPATDLRRKGGDDRNLALYFVFLPKSEAARLQGANVTRLLREDSVRVLVYVWGGAHSRGDVLDSPYLGARGKTIVLRGAGSGSASENVDLARDYARAFGGGDPAVVGLALSGDSDDTNSRIRAQVSGLRVE